MSSPSGIAGSVSVRLPAALRPHPTGRHTVELRAATVRDVIDALEADCPGMRFALCLETGALRPFVNLYVNGVHVRYLRGLETPTPEGTTIYIFQSVAGG